MSKFECPDMLKFWTPDECAECLEGIGDELYAKIWNKLVPQMEADQKKDKNIQEVGYMEYPDQKWDYSMKRYWNMLTEEEQLILVNAVDKHQQEYA